MVVLWALNREYFFWFLNNSFLRYFSFAKMEPLEIKQSFGPQPILWRFHSFVLFLFTGCFSVFPGGLLLGFAFLHQNIEGVSFVDFSSGIADEVNVPSRIRMT